MKRSLATVLLLSAFGQAQYPTWSHSGLLHIHTTPDGADLKASASVDDFPILVRLNRDFFDFAQAADSGADIRFATSTGEPMAYQVDEWNATAGMASVWVRVPQIRGNTTQAIRMFWGLPEAKSESSGEAVFGLDAGFAGVWHLGDEVTDATPNRLHGTDRGSTLAPAIVGHGRRFGPGAFIACGEKVDCLPAGNADRSMSAWLKPSSYASGPTIGGWGKQGAVHLSYMTLSSRGMVKFHGYAADPEGVTKVPVGEWHHAQLSIADGMIRFYFDGQLEHTTKLRELDTLVPSACYIGKHTEAGGRWARHFHGMLDEVRFAKVARSADWAVLCYQNQRPLQRLVGPLVAEGDTLSLTPAASTAEEGGQIELTAIAGGATKLYWLLRHHGDEQIVAVDQLHYVFDVGRTVSDDEVSLVLRAVYPDGVKTRTAKIRIAEALPEPVFSLSATADWNGRDRLEIRPRIINQAAMSQSGVGQLEYEWDVSGPAMTTRTEPGVLILERAQGSGTLNVGLRISNGGRQVHRSIVIAVREPSEDPWVTYVPAPDEQPRDHQFYARDKNSEGTLHCRGTLADTADMVYLRVFAADDLFAERQQKLSADGRYAFEVKLKAGLIKYRVEFGKQVDGKSTELHTAADLVCGDAYIIQGQSNAEAFDQGRADHPHRSDWIRSFGTPRTDPERARMRLWGDAAGFERADGKLQIGYWGMELAKQLVEQHKIPIFIINGAKGGTRIDQHQRSEVDPTDVTTIYGRLLWRLQATGLTHGIRGIFWHQGENDQGSAGSDGNWGWRRYERYFVELAAAWKRDYPNVENYYVFQIMPKACSMGSDGSDDMLREVQRRLKSRFSKLHILSTVGVRPVGGCHYPPAGYAKIAHLLYPLVARDVYGVEPKSSITPPNLLGAKWQDTEKTAVTLTFDQSVNWEDTLAPRFYLDGVEQLVRTGEASAGRLVLHLKQPTSARRITYLIGAKWNRKDPILRGTNGIAALTFCSVPIEEPDLPPQARNHRGDVMLQAGRFAEAIADFDAYIATEPRAEPYHWQRGIAYYYAGRYADGVRQFELHKTVNPNDVENAAWHFLCLAKLDGIDAAQKALLPVGPDARVPMMMIYELFAGRANTGQVEARADALSGSRAESARFYGHLYIGLYYEAIGNQLAARRHIRLAAGTYSMPHYMGAIARMHAKLLQ